MTTVKIVVRLTEEGVQAIPKIRTKVISRLAAMLEDLGTEEAKQYIRIQEKIQRNFQDSR